MNVCFPFWHADMLDEVVIGAPYVVDDALLKHFKVSVVAHGSTFYPEEKGKDPYALPKKLGMFKAVSSGSNVTTSVIVERIIKNRLQYEARNKKKEAKEMKIVENISISTPTQLSPQNERRKSGSSLSQEKVWKCFTEEELKLRSNHLHLPCYPTGNGRNCVKQKNFNIYAHHQLRF